MGWETAGACLICWGMGYLAAGIVRDIRRARAERAARREREKYNRMQEYDKENPMNKPRYTRTPIGAGVWESTVDEHGVTWWRVTPE